MEFPTETAEMRDFMFCIVPRSWNIYSNGTGTYICDVPGTLNIFLRVMEACFDPGRPLVLGAVHGPMSFVRLNNVMTSKVEVRIFLNKDIRLYFDDWKTTVIHELAHVAELRWIALRKKAHMREGDVGIPDLKGVTHGPMFQRALIVMLNRAMKAFQGQISERDVLSETVGDLDYYEYVDSR
ncbi:MAG: hypothetical protein JRI70_08160 [Deltaproteobacteria bacterium]|nr:hypothetical protein [Deltaproteobacteria bacterium]